MIFNDSDRAWEKFGKQDPYYGVLTADKYRKYKLTERSKEEFFKSGYDYINTVLNNIKKYIDPAYSIKKGLDFGCGVGRLVIPLAEVSESVVGVDVSISMLNEAKRNCELRFVRNVKFLISDDNLSLLHDKYDFIHSFIVFQHIPIKRGEHLFLKLLEHLDYGGVGVLHFTYAVRDNNGKFRKLVTWLKSYVPLVGNFINLIRKRSFFAPYMQMNMYNLNRLFFIMQNNNVRNLYCEYSDHDGALGITLYFNKYKKTD